MPKGAKCFGRRGFTYREVSSHKAIDQKQKRLFRFLEGSREFQKLHPLPLGENREIQGFQAVVLTYYSGVGEKEVVSDFFSTSVLRGNLIMELARFNQDKVKGQRGELTSEATTLKASSLLPRFLSNNKCKYHG